MHEIRRGLIIFFLFIHSGEFAWFPDDIFIITYDGFNIHTDHHPNDTLPFSDVLAKAVAVSNSLSNGTGVSAAVMIEGEGIWTGVTGSSSIGQPVENDMLFNIASAGKTFLAMLILQLVEEGKLSLNDSISSWISGYDHIDGSVTIRQLLNHTSGIFDWVSHPDSPYRIPYDSINHTEISSSEEVIGKLLADPLFRPGEGFYYSTTNYNILRIIAEKVTGNGLADEISRRFLDPLSLDNTFILDSLSDLPGSALVVHPWYDTDRDGIKDDISNNDIKWIASRSPCLVYCTASDLAVWTHSIFTNKVLKDSLLTEVMDFCRPTPGAPGSPLAKGYGLGIQELRLGKLVMYGHLGWEYGQTTSMLYIPDHSASIVVLINDNNMTLINLASIALIAVIEFQIHPGYSLLVLSCWVLLLSMLIFCQLLFITRLIKKYLSISPASKSEKLPKASVRLYTLTFINGIFIGAVSLIYLIYPVNINDILTSQGSLSVGLAIFIFLFMSGIASIILIYLNVIAWKRNLAPFKYKLYFSLVIIAEIILTYIKLRVLIA